MQTTISSVNMKYKDKKVDSAEVHFNSKTEDYSVNISGYFDFTKEEFEGKSIEQLETAIKEKLVDRIINPVEVVEEDEDLVE